METTYCKVFDSTKTTTIGKNGRTYSSVVGWRYAVYLNGHEQPQRFARVKDLRAAWPDAVRVDEAPQQPAEASPRFQPLRAVAFCLCFILWRSTVAALHAAATATATLATTAAGNVRSLMQFIDETTAVDTEARQVFYGGVALLFPAVGLLGFAASTL